MKALIIKHTQNWSDFQLALLHSRNVPHTVGLSPTQWIFHRPHRTLCPAISKGYELLEEEEIANAEPLATRHDLSTRPLPVLTSGQSVQIQNPYSGKWNNLGTVQRMRPNGRSYDVLADGRILTRNRNISMP
ncbi:hypothetical protein TCAL_09971, partial [Tigriopus californicus]|eukprot:TCALIF_09971-PA protein Name:"Protein of unknown function" AED:0.07 eAED:0.11 QI:17/0/0/1/0/0/2/0/131